MTMITSRNARNPNGKKHTEDTRVNLWNPI